METNSNRSFDNTSNVSDADDKLKIFVELNYTDRVNFAVQQNLISIFQELIVSNDSDETAEDLRVVVKAKPKLFEPIEARIDRILPRTRCRVEKVDEKMNIGLLAETSERIQGEVEVAVFGVEPTDESSEPLFFERYPITILPWDEWTGISAFPSLLAAFVTPNADGIAELASDACEIMKAKGEPESLEGYQSDDKDRVYQIVRAVYEAVLQRGIRYANPPASFESNGQRTRFVKRILREKLATCLDLSTLFASVLEYCGLNPIVMLQRGHAFVGCHLRDETFADSFVDGDFLQSIRKRVDLDQIVVFEATAVANGSRPSFADAEAIGKSKLEDEERFEGALDVKRARLENIGPIPLKRAKDDEFTVDLDSPNAQFSPRFDAAPRRLSKEVELTRKLTPKNRIDRWKQNLLDLSLRNKLLNLTDGNRSVPFLFPESLLGKLEDSLFDGKEFLIAASTPENDESSADARSANYRNATRFSEEVLKDAFEYGRLLVRPGIYQDETNKRLTTISRYAAASLTESGVNSLFLAFGTVEGFDAKEKNLRAPLLLIPVKLTGNALRNDFCLTRSDEDAILNVTLLELMRRDFGKEVRGLDPNDLPTDEHGVDVEKIFQIFRQELRDFSGWELKNELTLGLFSFQKFVMWSDLNVHMDDLMENSIVRHLVETPEDPYSDGIPIVDTEKIDADYSYTDFVTPLSADSSQLTAILTAERGKSFVLQGPPGTGKSQTIANIIAHCLYKGQKILFVAEKRAALDVVYRRLRNLGLGAFCLELHSNKSGKRQVLDQLNEALTLVDQEWPYDWDDATRKLESLKNNLNKYVEELHRARPNGSTLFQALSWLASREAIKTISEPLKLTGRESFATVSRTRFNELLTLGESLRDAASNVPESAWDDLRGIDLDDWSLKSNREIGERARAVRENGEALREEMKKFAKSLGLDGELKTVEDFRTSWELGRAVGDAEIAIPNGFYSRDWDENEPMFRRYIELERDVEERIAELYRNGWGVLQKLREEGTPYKQGASNVFELNESRFDVSDADVELSESEASARRTRLDFAVASADFYSTVQKTLRRLSLSNVFGEYSIWCVGELIKRLTVAKSPKIGFLLGDWNDFFERTKRLAEAVRARSAAQERIAPFDYKSAVCLDFSRVERDGDAARLPRGIFDVADAYDSNELSAEANDFSRAYGGLLKEAKAVKNAATKAFEEIGARGKLNEQIVSTYRPILSALMELPPRSARFLSKDWTFVSLKLRNGVEAGKNFAEAREKYATIDLDAVLNFDVISAKNELSTIPNGVFAFSDVQKRTEPESSFSGFSLDVLCSDGGTQLPTLNDDPFEGWEERNDLVEIEDFSRKVDGLIRAIRPILVELGVETQIDEKSALAINRIATLFNELDAPSEEFLSDDWEKFNRDARAFVDAGIKNEEIRKTLADFDLDKLVAFDVRAAREKWAKIDKSFVLLRGRKKRDFVAEIWALTTNGESTAREFDDFPQLFDAIESYVETKRRVDEFSDLGAKRFGKEWNDGRPDWQTLKRLLDLGNRIATAFCESTFEFAKGARLETVGRFWFAAGCDSSPERVALQEFNDAWNPCVSAVGRFVELVEEIQAQHSRLQKEFDRNADVCAKRFGDDWKGVDSDWAALSAYVDSGDRIADAVRNTNVDEQSVEEFLRVLGDIWNRKKIENIAFGDALREFCDSYDRCLASLRKFAPEFNAWKDNYLRQEETIGLETPRIIERFSAESNPNDWEGIAEAGNEIVKRVGKLFSNAEARELFLKKIDAFWNSSSMDNSEDNALVVEFLSSWKRYESASEKFFRSIDELPPDTNAFDADVETPEPQKVDLTNLATMLAEFIDAYSKFKRFETEIAGFTSFATKDGRYASESAESVLERVREIDDIARRFAAVDSLPDGPPTFDEDFSLCDDKTFDADKLAAVRDKIGAILAAPANDRVGENTAARANALETDFTELQDSSALLKRLLKYDSNDGDSEFADSELNFARRILRVEDELRVWISWNQIKAKAAPIFPALVDAIERRAIENSQIAEVARYLLCARFAADVVEESSALKEYLQKRDGHDKEIERFNALDDEYSTLAQRLVVASLAKNLSVLRNEEVSRETELGRLRREISARRHGKSVRAILNDIPNLLRLIKPCLLMSPLSVAQYFPSDGEKYDVVIFDEASQIPVWDAIGAVARGERLIVVGDSKQLPPTSFFQRAASEEDDELNEFAEPESILDECVAAQIAEIQLRWHYRSKREGLIAFSNSHYYDDKLYTFPSVDRKNTGVSFVYVNNGRYDRGGSKTNRIEARKLVDDVVRRMLDPAFSGKSIGIVTFNEAQKNAIEDLLDEERQKSPAIEPFFSPENSEPLFVKNLENVQGDERDVIYFSICFGPDSRGVVSTNFGPINKAGGERRLNVAITRAKEENVVFSSIRSSDIKLARASGASAVAERNGVRDLRDFLDYAESGGKRSISSVAASVAEDGGVSSSFEEEVAKFLRANGYEVKTQVGCSNYRIDLAIPAPDSPEEYVVGIECDGEGYRSAATARDRDILRRQVLENLGWRIVRVWSTTWLYDRAYAEKNLLAGVASAIDDWELERLERELEASEDESDSNDDEYDANFDADLEEDEFDGEEFEDEFEDEEETSAEPLFASAEIPFPPTPRASAVYDASCFELKKSTDDYPYNRFKYVNGEYERTYPSLDYLCEEIFANCERNSSSFYEPERRSLIKSQLKRIVDVEGPITKELIVKRIRTIWGFSRAGDPIRKIVELCLRGVTWTKQSGGTRVYWPSNVEPSTYRFYRIGRKRDFSDIPLQEFFNAVERVKTECDDLADEDELYRKTLKLFGVQRLTKPVKDAIEREKRNS